MGAIFSRTLGEISFHYSGGSGRFQERGDRLIKRDGEPEQVLRRQVGANGSELAATLAAHVGDNSPS